jgi:crossover junction endonuclease MUS81
VVLLIDVRERSGRKDASYIQEKLGKQGILCDARALSVSDFMWIARPRSPVSASAEVVLDAMIERKRVSDLMASIRDGRYQEQRARLKKTKLGRISYVIEGRVAEDTVMGLPVSTVESVLASMNVRRKSTHACKGRRRAGESTLDCVEC